MSENLFIRKAEFGDMEEIHEVLEYYGKAQLLLPREYDDIKEKLNNFLIAEVNHCFAGCVAIRDFSNLLFEIRSLAVKAEFAKQGIGSKLVAAAIEQCKQKGQARVFALTHHPNIFYRLQFKLVQKEIFPEKIWADCEKCPKIDHCDEVAVLYEVSSDLS